MFLLPSIAYNGTIETEKGESWLSKNRPSTSGSKRPSRIRRLRSGVYYVRTWLNEGVLDVGDSIMYVLIGADIRPNCIDALQKLVGKIKNDLVVEKEIYA